MLGNTVGGRYQVIRSLGGGGFGQTYLAVDQHLPGNPQCVVKKLQPKVTTSLALQAARRLFNQEAEVLYALGDHDQIPRLFAHFEENQEFYLVQEFVDGSVLSEEITAGQPLPEAEVVLLLQDILTTLAFVHQQNVIHRDIKPSNLIRRQSDRRIVLIDFGVVKQISNIQDADPDGQTSFTIAIGSSGYMPNEQMAGKPRFSSDIYAVGMVGLQALTGLYPAQLKEDLTTGEILWRDCVTGLDGAPMPVKSDLAGILDTMVRYDFRQRYASANEALAALNHLAPPNYATVILPKSHLVESDAHLVWAERGDEMFEEQRYLEAVTCYDKVVQAVPADYLAWFKRGMALENSHQSEAAIASYDQVIQLQPQDYLAWFKRGKVLENLQRYDEALVSYDQVIQIQPDNYWAWHDRGKVLENSQQYEEAVTAYDRAVQLKPDFQLAVDSRKRVLSHLKQVDQLYHLQHYAEAIAACDQVIQDNPTDAMAWLMRGMAQENSQQDEAAIASYRQVVQIHPDDHLAWFKQGTLLEKLERYEEALDAYSRVVQLQPDNHWAWHDRGRVFETLQRYEEAIASYERANYVKPDFQPAQTGQERASHQIGFGRFTCQSVYSGHTNGFFSSRVC